MPEPRKSESAPTVRDALILLGVVAFTAGSLFALGLGYGLMVAGAAVVLLAFFALRG